MHQKNILDHTLRGHTWPSSQAAVSLSHTSVEMRAANSCSVAFHSGIFSRTSGETSPPAGLLLVRKRTREKRGM